ncbi:hypothetical protein ACIBCM_01020 [Streptomyces sp. NPDC051018]|uniref:hypothetical protein n=1 Tax=Streptomyces sp. NPDC051018 TaxID=3365639 RepID=UPI003789BF5C
MTTEGQTPGTTGKEAEVIQLLLEEYRALRAEITQRVTERVQIVAAAGVGAVILTAAGGFSFGKPHLYAAFGVVLFALAWSRKGARDMAELGRHVRGLEIRINALAAEAYGVGDVLSWELTSERLRRRRTSIGPIDSGGSYL